MQRIASSSARAPTRRQSKLVWGQMQMSCCSAACDYQKSASRVRLKGFHDLFLCLDCPWKTRQGLDCLSEQHVSHLNPRIGCLVRNAPPGVQTTQQHGPPSSLYLDLHVPPSSPLGLTDMLHQAKECGP